MKARILALAFTAVLAQPARAEFLTGEQLSRLLAGSDDAKNQALGYIVGVHDALRGGTHCSTTDLTAIALRDQVAQMLEQVGNLRAFSADLLIGKMLEIRYPCKDEKAPASVNPRSNKTT